MPRFFASARACLTVLLPFSVIPAPHYIYDRQAIIHYIHDILFGKFRDTYAFRGSRAEHLFYYLNGDGGAVMLGRHLPLLLCLFGVGVAAILLTRGRQARWRAAMLLPLVTVTWIIPTILRTKQPFFGLCFDFTLAGAGLLLLGRLLAAERSLRRRRLPLASVLICALTVLGISRFQWPKREGDAQAGWELQRREMVESIYNTIVSHCAFGHLDNAPPLDASIPDDQKVEATVPCVAFLHLGDMNAALLSYMAIQRQIPMRPVFNIEGAKPSDFLPSVDGADFVICSQSGTQVMADFMPTGAMADDMVAEMRARPEFEEIGRWSFVKAPNRYIYLFMRHETQTMASFFGFSDISGIGPVEGPIPAANLRIVRWGMGPMTTLGVHADSPGDYILRWTARTDFQRQVVTVLLNGKEIQRVSLPGSYTDFYHAKIPLHLAGGDNTLQFKYARWHTEGDRAMGVLFKRLRIDPANPSPPGTLRARN